VKGKTGLVALMAADLVSTLGSRITTVALPWLVLVTTGSPAKMGLVAATAMVPYLITGVFAAPLADRLGLRRISIGSDIFSTVAMFAVAATPNLPFTGLLALVTANGLVRGIGDRTTDVMLRPMAEVAKVDMKRVAALYETLGRLTTLIGASLGGLLILWFGAQGTIFVDAASYLACALAVWLLVHPPEEPKAESTAREPYFRQLWAGVSYLRKDELLFAMIVMAFFANVFIQANNAVFVPLWVADVLRSPAMLGTVLGSFAIGALVGSLVFNWLALKVPQYLTYVLGILISSAPRLFVLAWSNQLAVVVVVTFLSGVAACAINPILGAMLFERVPAELQTRVFGLLAAVSFAGFPLGGLLSGASVSWFGLHPALLVFAIVCLAVTAAPLLLSRPRSRIPAAVEAGPEAVGS
jgi:MFS family permease